MVGGRVLCLLWNTVLPSRILLVLRNPKTLSLTTRAVVGELKSLNQESNLKYFDKVHIASQLGPYSNYEFGSESLISKACNPYPYKDDFLNDAMDVYKGSGFCGILERLASGEGFTVVSNWKCNGTKEYCNKLGPFVTGREIKATDGGFNNARLVMQDVRCEPKLGKSSLSSARVSATFRAVPPYDNQYTAADRTGHHQQPSTRHR